MKELTYDGKIKNPFGLSDSEAQRVCNNIIKSLYTLKAEQDGEEGEIVVKILDYSGGKSNE